MALNMPRLDLADLTPRRAPVTEEACEQRTCPCWKDGFAAGVRQERERKKALEQGPPWVFTLLAGAVFVALFAIWLAGVD